MIISVLYMLVNLLGDGMAAPAALVLFVIVDVALIESAHTLLFN